MLDCRQATKLMSQRMDRKLGLAERMGLKLHLMMCGGCRNFGRQMHFLRESLRRLPGRDR
jgi:predicted anti-sigma-YlaC factor YlaD